MPHCWKSHAAAPLCHLIYALAPLNWTSVYKTRQCGQQIVQQHKKNRSIEPMAYILPVIHIVAPWLSGRVLDSRPRGHGFEPHRRHCVVSLSKNITLSLELVQPRKTRPFITELLLMGRKKSNQTNKIMLTSDSSTTLKACLLNPGI